MIKNPRPGGGGEGLISMRAALGGSQNVGAFRAAVEAGMDNVIEMAKRVGITTLDQAFLDPPSASTMTSSTAPPSRPVAPTSVPSTWPT